MTRRGRGPRLLGAEQAAARRSWGRGRQRQRGSSGWATQTALRAALRLIGALWMSHGGWKAHSTTAAPAYRAPDLPDAADSPSRPGHCGARPGSPTSRANCRPQPHLARSCSRGRPRRTRHSTVATRSPSSGTSRSLSDGSTMPCGCSRRRSNSRERATRAGTSPPRCSTWAPCCSSRATHGVPWRCWWRRLRLMTPPATGTFSPARSSNFADASLVRGDTDLAAIRLRRRVAHDPRPAGAMGHGRSCCGLRRPRRGTRRCGDRGGAVRRERRDVPPRPRYKSSPSTRHSRRRSRTRA